MEIDRALPLSPLQVQLYPLLALFKRGNAKTMFQLQYAAYVQRKARRKELRRIDKEVGAEAKVFEQILIGSLTRMGFAYTPNQDHKTAAGGQKHRVQRIRFERVRWNDELIYFRILTRQRGLFAHKNALPYKTYVTEIVDETTLNELSVSCERKVSARWDRPERGAWLVVHRLEGAGGIPRLIHYRETLNYYPADMSKGTFLLGVGEHRTIHYNDLATHPHILIGGQTGGGKSNLVNNFIASQIRFQDSDTFKLVLIDLKRMEFGFYKQAPHLLCPVIYDPVAAIKHLEFVREEIEQRAGMFDGKAKELSEWNRLYPNQKLPRIVTVIDEYAELMLSGQKIAKTITHLVARISALGRAVGIHLIICTQRPDAQVVPGLIRMNMGTTISGFAPNDVQSRVIIGTSDAQNLPSDVKGRMIFARGSDKVEIQTPLITDEDVRESVRIARGKHEGLIELAPVDPIVIPAGLAKFALANTKGSLAANDIAPLLRDFAIDFNMYKNAVDELAKRGVVEVDDSIYQIVPGEQGYRVLDTLAKWEDVPAATPVPEITLPAIRAPIPVLLLPARVGEPAVGEDDTQPAPPVYNQYEPIDHDAIIDEFIRLCCVQSRNSKVAAAVLHEAYTRYCNQQGVEPLAKNPFGRELTKRKFEKKLGTGGSRYWIGLAVAEVVQDA